MLSCVQAAFKTLKAKHYFSKIRKEKTNGSLQVARVKCVAERFPRRARDRAREAQTGHAPDDAARAAETPLRRRTDNRGLKLVIDCEIEIIRIDLAIYTRRSIHKYVRKQKRTEKHARFIYLELGAHQLPLGFF